MWLNQHGRRRSINHNSTNTSSQQPPSTYALRPLFSTTLSHQLHPLRYLRVNLDHNVWCPATPTPNFFWECRARGPVEGTLNRGMGSGLPMSMLGIDSVVLRKRWIWVVLYVYVFRFLLVLIQLRDCLLFFTGRHWHHHASCFRLSKPGKTSGPIHFLSPWWIDLHCWSLSVASSGNFWSSGKPIQPTSSRFLTWLKGRARMVSFSLSPSSLLALSESPLRLLLDRHHLIQIEIPNPPLALDKTWYQRVSYTVPINFCLHWTCGF